MVIRTIYRGQVNPYDTKTMIVEGVTVTGITESPENRITVAPNEAKRN